MLIVLIIRVRLSRNKPPTRFYLMKKSILLTVILTTVLLAGCSSIPKAENADLTDEDSILLKGTQYILDENGKRTFGRCYDVKSYRDVELTGSLNEKLIDAGYTFAVKTKVAEDCKLSGRAGTNFDIKLQGFERVSVYFPISMGRRLGDTVRVGTVVTIAYSPKAGPILLLQKNPETSPSLIINSLVNKSDISTSHVIDLIYQRDAELIICDMMNQHTILNQNYTNIWAAEFDRVVGQINTLRNVPPEIKKKVNAVHSKLKPLKSNLSSLNSSLEKALEDMNNDAGLAVALENNHLMRAHCLWALHLLEVFRDRDVFTNVEPDQVR